MSIQFDALLPALDCAHLRSSSSIPTPFSVPHTLALRRSTLSATDSAWNLSFPAVRILFLREHSTSSSRVALTIGHQLEVVGAGPGESLVCDLVLPAVLWELYVGEIEAVKRPTR